MAIIRDVMSPFELFQPASTDDALALLDEHGADAWVFAGGLDSLDWFKDRVKRPKVVVSLSGVEELKQIRSTDEGLEIGAMATLIDVINHPEVRAAYSTLSDAARAAASPQIGTRARLVEMSRRTHGAGITEMAGPVTERAGTSATPAPRPR